MPIPGAGSGRGAGLRPASGWGVRDRRADRGRCLGRELRVGPGAEGVVDG